MISTAWKSSFCLAMLGFRTTNNEDFLFRLLISTGSLLGSNSEVSLHRLDMSAMECLGNSTLQMKMNFKCARVFPQQSQSLGKVSAEVEIFNWVLNLILFFHLLAYPQIILSLSALYILKEILQSLSVQTLRVLAMNY